MQVNFAFRPAKPSDENAIKRFLTACQLPAEDITADQLEHFVIIRQQNKVIATVGVEICGPYGLLRSLAVAESNRGQQLGIAMSQIIEDHARNQGVRGIYLLTTTADKFFSKQGYRVIDRESAPAKIQAIEEFKNICPASAVCMVKNL